ncbi:MAG: shikimate kinase [Bacteroidia bacterium]|nr:shikimate kinase [Bacteroidia bacterium]
MRITLIGFMGCGKTTVGTVLADRMGYEFLDLDKVIETTANNSISGIFKTHGEEEFRKLEQEALKVALSKNNCVIATGGGTPCFFDNMEMINKDSVSVYLKMSVDSLFERLETEQGQRPLISNFNDKELKKFISELLLKREPYYNKAHYKVKAKNIQIGALADFIRQECLSSTDAHIK